MNSYAAWVPRISSTYRTLSIPFPWNSKETTRVSQCLMMASLPRKRVGRSSMRWSRAVGLVEPCIRSCPVPWGSGHCCVWVGNGWGKKPILMVIGSGVCCVPWAYSPCNVSLFTHLLCDLCVIFLFYSFPPPINTWGYKFCAAIQHTK